MNNLEKLIQAGKIIFGDNWQSPMSRLIGIDDRSVRRYVAGKSRPPFSRSLRDALEKQRLEIERAIAIVDADLVNGSDITLDVITDIVSQYSYSDIQYEKAAVDQINNAILPETYLSDLHQIALKWSNC
ncbi:hypothetical protein R9X49_21950 [Pectobacterium carotovorum]|uniref:hypothetical protein n=1 Tax=Pectobacterium carotovorum TaxID=554 RepID=UPI0029D7831A|nr:hypothetical protein [Pectobacterium carotovorum]MDX6917762.1 hypothetical protein [Pectobacterium carotovorum]